MKNYKLIQKIISRNKKQYLEYNGFRKKVFAELEPDSSWTILYLLPWLLSVNHSKCPGYVSGMKRPFKVYNIDNDSNIRKSEKNFKKMFGVTKKGTLLKPTSETNLIHGLYTIGSVGTMSQTSISDCDIWVCFDKNQLSKTDWRHFHEKIHLIKGWMDLNTKMPVFFFISDISAIKENRFGHVDSESSGSTQQNVLKEEFYRTCILICGKIPLWWLCYDKDIKFDYDDALHAVKNDYIWEDDLVDFGNLENVKKTEYFGSALWQLHKSLTSPLKSIIKMILLKILLDSEHEELICHLFRKIVLFSESKNIFPDYSLFTINIILDSYQTKRNETLDFIKECFYIRCEINPYAKKQVLKNKLAEGFLKQHPINKNRQTFLRKSKSWDYKYQIEFGDRLLKLFLRIYKEISAAHSMVVSESDRQDLTILGRKISACYLKKKNKIPVLQKPTGDLNINSLTLSMENKRWYTFVGNDRSSYLVSHTNIIYHIALIVWNNLFNPSYIRMRPNSTNITHREIINLGNRMKDFFGTYHTLDIELAGYLKDEYMTKMLIIAGFEKSPWEEKTDDYSVVYINCWGELFVERFREANDFKKFLKDRCSKRKDIQISKYLKRNFTSYEKTIERPKSRIFSTIKI